MTRSDKAILVICSLFILVFRALIFILPQQDFSESENRYLAKLPKFSVDSFLSGEYAKNISSFYTDQFPLRNAAASLYAISERSLGKKTVGEVICYKKQLIPIAESKKQFNEIQIPAVIVNSKYTLFKSQSSDLAYYYNTDHHRTTYGAYLLYIEACKALEITPYPESYFTKETVSDNFYGTSFFKSRLPRFAVSADSIELWRYPNDGRIILTIHDNDKAMSGFYDFSKLDTTDKYAVFLGGNYAHASVTSPHNKPTLLLFKDSFANAVIPFLSLHYNITLIDPRYATKTQISSLCSSENYDAYLFIGCLESFE